MTRLPYHQRRRWLSWALLAFLIALLGWLLASYPNVGAEELIAFIGLVVALVMLRRETLPALPPPTDAAKQADDLAVSVRGQWEEEVASRNLRVPRVIPLSWSATSRPVAASAEETHGATVEARVLGLSLNGRLDGDFNQAARQLAHGYQRVPSGRLVVLGEPGGGKTALATILNLGLLAEREPGGPVPVLLTLSGWDPSSESLSHWIERALGTAHYGGQIEIPRLLLRSQRLLLILDGLDEIPENSRRDAVVQINKTSGEGTGVVLTCRSAEFQDVIEGGSPVLRRAPVVEVAPVSASDAVAYLSDVSWPDGVEWEPVFAQVRADPGGPTAVALSTPLALTMARTVYSRCARDPAELLTFDSPYKVQDHLLDHLVTAAYAPASGGGQRNTDDWQHRAKRAESYLTFLAGYLHRHRERDLAWWHMSHRLSSRLTGLALGVGAGYVAMFAMLTGLSFAGWGTEAGQEYDEIGETAISLAVGLGCAILTMIVWYATPGSPPGRLSFKRDGSLKRLGKGFATGLRLTSILIVPVCVTAAVALVWSGNWTQPNAAELALPTVAAGGVALAISLALAAHSWLDAPSEHSRKASPSGLLRQDRSSSLVGALGAGAVLGAAAAPLFILGHSVAFIVISSLTYGTVTPSAADFIAERFNSSVYSSTTSGTISTLLPAAAFTLLILLTRAWPRFLLIRLSLAARGKLPWRFTRFLSEARSKELLRQSGGYYQFRHIRLQERLAHRELAQDRGRPTRLHTPRGRTLRAAMATAVTAALLVGVLATRNSSTHDAINTGDVEYMTFDEDTKSLITINEQKEVRQWDIKTGAEIISRRHSISDPYLWDVTLPIDYGFYPGIHQERLVAIADGLLRFRADLDSDGIDFEIDWDLIPWQEGNKIEPPPFHGGESYAYDVSANRKYQLSVNESTQGDESHTLTRINVETKEEDSCHIDPVGLHHWWRISGDGESIVAFSYSETDMVGYVAVGDFLACQELEEIVFGYHQINSAALSADGKILAVNVDGVTRLQNLDE